MTRIRCIVCLAAILCGLCGCSKQIDPLGTELPPCEQLAKKSALNASCAVELAKKEIVRRQGQLDYQRFEARFDEPDKLWVVEAIHEPEIHGGYVVVSIHPNGQVEEYSPGL
jgi:hypothetical protein